MLIQEQTDTICKYYQNHTAASTRAAFKLSRNQLDTILRQYKIAPHSIALSNTLMHLEQDGYDQYNTDKINSIYNTYANVLTVERTCELCQIKEYYLIYLLDLKNIVPNYAIKIDFNWRSKLSDKQIQEILAYYNKPNTLSDTSIRFGISVHNIKCLLKEFKINLHSKDVTEKLGKAKQQKHLNTQYGVTNVFQLASVKEKSTKTKLDRYGDAHFTNRKAASLTCLEKYGSDTFLGSDEAKIAFIKSAEQRQANYLAKIQAIPELYLFSQCYNSRELTIKVIQSLEHNTVSQLANALNIDHNLAYSLVTRLDLFDYIDLETTGASYAEEELVQFIGAGLCVRHDRTVLAPYELDIYIPSKKIGIEFNGTYWHSSICKDKNYHFDKSKLAELRGIRLIHIYEYEWQDVTQRKKIELMLNIALGRAANKIYARQCSVKQITNQEAAVLNKQVHLQGHRNAQVTYGLFYNNTLVQLMSFSKTKYNKNLIDDNAWEIIRGCPGSNNLVVGGVSKLFKHFITDYNPSQVFSYCDFNKFNGTSYEVLGMTFVGYTGPDMKWLLKSGQVVNRKPNKHAELKKQAKAQIFGAGSKKYLWYKA